jgi:hypothetical protein
MQTHAAASITNSPKKRKNEKRQNFIQLYRTEGVAMLSFAMPNA